MIESCQWRKVKGSNCCEGLQDCNKHREASYLWEASSVLCCFKTMPFINSQLSGAIMWLSVMAWRARSILLSSRCCTVTCTFTHQLTSSHRSIAHFHVLCISIELSRCCVWVVFKLLHSGTVMTTTSRSHIHSPYSYVTAIYLHSALPPHSRFIMYCLFKYPWTFYYVLFNRIFTCRNSMPRASGIPRVKYC